MSEFFPGIPKPISNESLASWMQRVCQVYGLTFSRFHDTFETSPNIDPDLCMSESRLKAVAEACGIPLVDMQLIQNCFCKFADRPYLRKLLLTQSNGNPLYQFCGQCLATDKIPYLRLEWRFKHWQYCPIHRNPLSTKCPSCSKPLAMHRSILAGTVSPVAVPNIAMCLFCREDIRASKHHRKDIIQDDADMAAIIAFQSAVISAVMHDYFLLEFSEEKHRLEELIGIFERIGL